MADAQPNPTPNPLLAMFQVPAHLQSSDPHQNEIYAALYGSAYLAAANDIAAALHLDVAALTQQLRAQVLHASETVELVDAVLVAAGKKKMEEEDTADDETDEPESEPAAAGADGGGAETPPSGGS